MFSQTRTTKISAHVYPVYAGTMNTLLIAFGLTFGVDTILPLFFAVICHTAYLTFTKGAIPQKHVVTVTKEQVTADIDPEDPETWDDKVLEPNEKAMLAGWASMITPARDLLLCHSVKRIDTDNIINYFLSHEKVIKNPSIYLRILNTYVASVPRLEEACEAMNINRTELQDIKFLRYHTSTSSTGKLVVDAYAEFMPLSQILISESDIKAAESAMRSPWELKLHDAVSDDAKATVYIMLKTGKKELRDWVQGKRAYESMPAASKARVETACEKFIDIRGETSELKKATTVAELMQALA
jgi:hypothetical protein